jgi:hypothetical protein
MPERRPRDFAIDTPSPPNVISVAADSCFVADIKKASWAAGRTPRQDEVIRPSTEACGIPRSLAISASGSDVVAILVVGAACEYKCGSFCQRERARVCVEALSFIGSHKPCRDSTR